MVGFCSSPRFLEHNPGPTHPERPQRLCAIYAALRKAGLITAPDPCPGFDEDFGVLPRFRQKLVELSFATAAQKWPQVVHTPRHIMRVQRLSELGGGVLDSGDTPIGPEGYEIAMLALGAVLRCCDAVMKGEVRRCFAAVRPPGHHAEPDRAMGFCVFSNVAIAARYLQITWDIQRVAIVDFDVHHGNGTQAAFETDNTVYYVSLHQHPRTCYPGTGYGDETGLGEGKGYTLNVPLDPGSGDEEYLKAIDTLVIPALDRFAPQFLLLSAGFDAHVDDPLGSMEVSDEGFELITRRLADLADRHCDGRVVSVLEGGYNLSALGRSVVRHLMGLGAA